MDEGWQAKTIWVLTWQPCQPSGNGKEHTTNRGTSGFQYGLVSYWGGNSSQSCSEKESTVYINQQTPSPQQHGTSCSQHVKVATIRVTRTELFRCFRNLVFEKPLCLENCAIPQNRGTQGGTRLQSAPDRRNFSRSTKKYAIGYGSVKRSNLRLSLIFFRAISL